MEKYADEPISLMELSDEDFLCIYGDIENTGEVANECETCKCSAYCEHHDPASTIYGYDDRGEPIVIACKFNEK